MLDQLKQEHESVSLEMTNPFTQAGAYVQSRLSRFMRQATDQAIHVVSGLTSNKSSSLTGSIPAGSIQQIAKTYSYSDVARIQVFVPSTLRPKVTMDVYSTALLKHMLICKDIVDFAGQEIVDTLNKYISLPDRLKDLTTAEQGDVTLDIMGRIISLRKEFESLTNATGTHSQRPYSEAYRRNLDYVKAIQNAVEISKILDEIINKLPAYKKVMEEAGKRSKELMTLIEKNPEQYALGNAAGAHLSNLAFAFAEEAEYVGSAIQAARVYIKAMVDTHAVINQATERFRSIAEN